MKLLLPVDGSECSNQSMEWAASTFDKQTTEYFLLYVIPIIPDLVTVEYDVVEANSILRKARIFLEEKGCKVINADYQLGSVTDQICRCADLMEIDQVIIGSHGRSGLAKFLLGSTAEAVLEHCHKPAIVYRSLEQKAVTGQIKSTFSNTIL
jgi:nucleotide-binding universal stress UspA family protein